MEGARPTISVIVPAFNEAEDIRDTLDALLVQTYPGEEIIVVDDASTDDTARIAAEYSGRSVQLIRQPVNLGISASRNAGIVRARGEVVLFNDADVRPRADFLERVARHYQDGADVVLSETKVSNVEYLYPRFLQAQYELAYGHTDSLDHTQGFSCRRALAVAAGMYPVTPIPLPAGEDSEFGRRVSRRGKKVIDRSIVVRHSAPPTFRSFWKQQCNRGRATPLVLFFLQRRSLRGVWIHALIKTAYVAAKLVTLISSLVVGIRLARYSRRGFADAVLFAYVYAASQLAETSGVWRGVRELQAWVRANETRAAGRLHPRGQRRRRRPRRRAGGPIAEVAGPSDEEPREDV